MKSEVRELSENVFLGETGILIIALLLLVCFSKIIFEWTSRAYFPVGKVSIKKKCNSKN